MDASKRDIERKKNANENDQALLKRAYAAHLRAGGTTLEFAREAKEKVKKAEDALYNAKIAAAKDIEYMLCRTAEKIIPKWPNQISAVELYESAEQEKYRTLYELSQLIQKGELDGRIRTIDGVWLVHGQPMGFLCSEGIFNTAGIFIWHRRTTPWEDILHRCDTHHRWIYCVGMRQQAEVIMGGLPKLRDYFEVRHSDQDTNGFPVAIEKDEYGRNIASILRGGTFLYEIVHEQSLRNTVDFLGDQLPAHEKYYSRAVDAFRFEANRRKRGEPASRLIEYLKERDCGKA